MCYMYIRTVYVCRIYNEQLHLLQCNRGHDDIIKSIIHIPELNQVSINSGALG